MRKIIFLLAIVSCLSGVFSGDVHAAEARWYVIKAGQKNHSGPYSQSEIMSQIKSGAINSNDYVWTNSMGKKWSKVAQTPPFNGASPSTNDAPETPPPSNDMSDSSHHRHSSRSIFENDSDSDQIKGFVTPLLGAAIAASNATGGPFFIIGGEAGVHTGFGNFGVYVSDFSTSSTVLNVLTVSASVIPVMLSYTRQFGYFYIGFRAGVGIRTLSASSGSASVSNSGSSFAFGAVVGSRIPINSMFSVDIDAMYFSASQTTISSTTYDSIGYFIPTAGVTWMF